MPRSMLLSLVAVFALAACSKPADTGAAPAPETAEAPEAQALPADTTATVVDDTAAAVEEAVPAEEPTVEETVPAEEPAMDAPAAEETMDSTTVPAETADSAGY